MKCTDTGKKRKKNVQNKLQHDGMILSDKMKSLPA